ncbi:MAG: hypothetical protein JXR03_10205 [Cyclobacteriaceae bacterium]
MKIYIPFILLLLLVSIYNSAAQSNAIIGNLRFSLSTQKSNTLDLKSQSSAFLISPSFSYMRFTSSKNIHQFKLSRAFIQDQNNIQFSDDGTSITNGSKISSFGFSFAYEFDYLINKRSKSNFNLYIGSSIENSFSRSTFDPKVILFTTKTFGYSLSSQIIPKVIYNFGKTTFLSFSFPVRVILLHWGSQRTKNPQLTTSQQKNSNFKTEFFPTKRWHELEVGFGVKF